MLNDQRFNRLFNVAKNRQAGLTVVMEDVFDPHNLGAITRSCDAFGIHTIHVLFDQQPPYDPNQVGHYSSSYTNKWVEYEVSQDVPSHLQALKDDGWHLLATIADDKATSLFDTDLTHPKLALLVGNEKDGLSDTATQLADSSIYIPMMGMAKSFNVSVATAILLAEITRQRLISSHNYHVTHDQALDILKGYLKIEMPYLDPEEVLQRHLG